MTQVDISRRSFMAAGLGLLGAQFLAGAGCSSASPADGGAAKGAADELVERVVPAKSVIWQSHAAAVEDAAKNGADAVMDFTAGSPTNLTPDSVKKAVLEVLEQPSAKAHAYSTPMGIPEVREKIAAYLSKSYGTKVSMEHLIMTAGASQAISLAVAMCCPINAEVLVIAPYYTDYELLIENQQCKLVAVPARESDFQIDVGAVEKALTEKSYAMLINTPNNPTGAIYTRETLEALAAMLKRKAEEFGHPIYLFSDEPYRELLFEKAELTYVPSLYDYTLICYSWSKSLALPGERVGYLYVGEKCTGADELLAKVEGLGYSSAHMCANVTYTKAVAECIGAPVDMAQYQANRAITMKIMDDCGYKYVKPQGAFYLWVKSPIDDDAEFCKMAQKYHIYLAPGMGFGQPGYFRITLCMDTKKYEQSREGFEALMKECRK